MRAVLPSAMQPLDEFVAEDRTLNERARACYAGLPGRREIRGNDASSCCRRRGVGTGRCHRALARGRLVGPAVGPFAGLAHRHALGGMHHGRTPSVRVGRDGRPRRGAQRSPDSSIWPAAPAAASSPAGSWNGEIGAPGPTAAQPQPTSVRTRPPAMPSAPAWRGWRLARPPPSPVDCRWGGPPPCVPWAAPWRRSPCSGWPRAFLPYVCPVWP